MTPTPWEVWAAGAENIDGGPVTTAPPPNVYSFNGYENLPPGVERHPDFGLIRRVHSINGATGEPKVRIKRVALTREEAVAKRFDFYSPEHGWLIDGFKRERDRDERSIMADNSISVAARIENAQ